MFLRELFEAENKSVAVTFGRLNPPTIGHEKLVSAVLKQSADQHFLFVSQTSKTTGKNDVRYKNPIPFDIKLGFIEKAFTNIPIGDTSVKTVIDMMKHLENQGFNKVIFVCGDDRVQQFDKLLNEQNGIDYNIDDIEIVSSGARDPDGEGAEGMSGTKLRQAVIDNDLEKFKSGLASGLQSDAAEVFAAVRTGLQPWIGEKNENINELSGEEDYYKFILGKLKLGRVLTKREQEFLKTYRLMHKTEGTKMKLKDFIPPSKPRNPVVRQQQTSGAGAHKDKKRAEKQGDVKHKGKQFDEGRLGVAGRSPSPEEKKKQADYRNSPGMKKFMFQGLTIEFTPDELKMYRGGDLMYSKSGNFKDPTKLQVNSAKVIASRLIDKIKQQDMSERIRDPEDWDEGNTEPPNNMAVYINGKLWKVFQGNGYYADDEREMRQYYKLQDWARRKSQETGKKWEVSRTGAPATA